MQTLWYEIFYNILEKQWKMSNAVSSIVFFLGLYIPVSTRYILTVTRVPWNINGHMHKYTYAWNRHLNSAENRTCDSKHMRYLIGHGDLSLTRFMTKIQSKMNFMLKINCIWYSQHFSSRQYKLPWRTNVILPAS